MLKDVHEQCQYSTVMCILYTGKPKVTSPQLNESLIFRQACTGLAFCTLVMHD